MMFTINSWDLERGLDAAGSTHKFQLVMIFAFFFVKIMTDSFYCPLPYFLTDPKILCYDSTSGNYSIQCDLREVCKMNHDGRTENSTIAYTMNPSQDEAKQTFITDFMLMCDGMKIGLLASTASIGNLLANIVSPFMTDNLGRIRTILIVLVFDVIIKSFLFYSKNLTYIVFILTFINLTNNLVYTAASLYINEMVASAKRGTYSCWFNGLFGISGMTYTVLFKLTSSWRYLHGFSILCSVISFIAVYIFLVESIRYSFMKQDNAEIVRSLTKIAKMNHREEYFQDWYDSVSIAHEARTFPAIMTDSTAETEHQGKSQSSVLLIFIHRQNLYNFTAFSFISLVTISGLIYNAVDMKYSENTFLFPLLFYFTDFTIIVIIGYVIDLPYFGRKIPSLFFSIICSIFYLVKYIIHFYSNNQNNLDSKYVFLVDFIIRFGVSISFNILIEYNLEIYPTDIRSMAFNLNKLFSRFGDFITPLAMSINHGRTTLAMSIMFFIMALFIMNLKETASKALNENIADEENENARDKFFEHKSI